MNIRTRAAIGGAAIAAALAILAVRGGCPSPGGGFYDERGDVVVPLELETEKALEPRLSGRDPGFRREEAARDGIPVGCRLVWTTFWVRPR